MSVLAKARGYERGFPQFLFDIVTQYQEGGADYIVAILNGYEQPPADFKPPTPTSQYNKYFPGHAIGMPKPLSDGQVDYTDGTPTTVAQYSKDVTAFLMWSAEPHLEARKKTGLHGGDVSAYPHLPALLHQEANLARRPRTCVTDCE